MKHESHFNTIVHINLNKKLTRKRSAANPQAAFEEAGAGNEVYHTIAPVLDPTCLGRAKYRSIVKVQIQCYLIAIVKNIKRLLKIILIKFYFFNRPAI